MYLHTHFLWNLDTSIKYMRKQFTLVGASRKCLILSVDGERVFCSPRNYERLMNDPNVKWEVVTRMESHYTLPNGAERYFPESKWVQVYMPRIF